MLFASANLTDSILLRGKESEHQLSPGAIIATSGFFNLLLAIVLGLWVLVTHRSIEVGTFLVLVANGLTYVLAIRILLNVMNEEPDTSRAIAWLQVIPVFGTVGAHFVLREVPGWVEVLAIAILVSGGFVLSVKHGVVKRKLMVLMIVSAGLLALNDVVFAKFGRKLDHDMVSAIFVNTSGIAFWGLASLLISQDRKDFFRTIKAKLGMRCASEVGFVGADVSMRIALLGTPVAIVQAIGCSQPLFALIGETLLAKRYPDVFEAEGKTKQKFVGIMLTVVGGVLLAFVST
jgi:drug/metabolite transporter (DMT)-like permease